MSLGFTMTCWAYNGVFCFFDRFNCHWLGFHRGVVDWMRRKSVGIVPFTVVLFVRILGMIELICYLTSV